MKPWAEKMFKVVKSIDKTADASPFGMGFSDGQEIKKGVGISIIKKFKELGYSITRPYKGVYIIKSKDDKDKSIIISIHTTTCTLLFDEGE